jgi:hypothetical protein
MKTTLPLIKSLSTILLGSSLLFGCTSGKEQVEDDLAPTEETAQAEGEEDKDKEEAGTQEAGTQEAGTQEAAEQEEAVAQEEAAPADDTFPSDSGTDEMPPGKAKWVVRYIGQDSTAIYSKKESTSKTEQRLTRGDHVFVVIEGDWAKLSKDRYLRTSSLKSLAVPRTRRRNEWNSNG